MLSLKDYVFNGAGRLGQIVGSCHKTGEETSYRVLWLDTDTIGDALESQIHKYFAIYQTVEE